MIRSTQKPNNSRNSTKVIQKKSKSKLRIGQRPAQTLEQSLTKAQIPRTKTLKSSKTRQRIRKKREKQLDPEEKNKSFPQKAH